MRGNICLFVAQGFRFTADGPLATQLEESVKLQQPMSECVYKNHKQRQKLARARSMA